MENGSRPTVSAASRRAPCPASARAAITPCCSPRPRRRPGAWCWSTASRRGSRRRPGASRSAPSATRPDVVHPDGDRRIVDFQSRALADLDVARRGRHRGQPGGGRLPRARPRHPALAAAASLRPGAADGAPAALGARLPCPAPREPGLRFQRRGHRRARAVAAVSGRAADLGGDRRQLPARADLVPQLPVRRGARARPRLHRGSRLARRVRLVAERQRCDAAALRGRSLARSGRGLAPGRGSAPAAPLPDAARARGRCLRGAPRRRQDHRRRLPLVHRLGPRHLHHAARLHDLAGRPGAGARHPARLGAGGVRGHGAEPLPGCRRAARVQRGRRLALVRDRGARAAEAAQRRRHRARGRRPAAAAPRDPPDRRRLPRRHALRHPHGRRTGCSPPACLASSSPGWTPRSATG